MKILIKFKSDQSTIPYCAYVETPAYRSAWSSESFKDAEQTLLKELRRTAPTPPSPKTVIIPDA